ncbi:hypothetical protein KAR91_83705 [Candidatus Pacearchaeota archaeon]|nr:hypothetical protein [Candidatus Pacearchaeota archaeon]
MLEGTEINLNRNAEKMKPGERYEINDNVYDTIEDEVCQGNSCEGCEFTDDHQPTNRNGSNCRGSQMRCGSCSSHRGFTLKFIGKKG